MRRKKIFSFIILGIVATGILTGCNGTTSREKEYTETLMSQANDAIGNPDIVNFFEKAQLKEIYEMRDDPNLVCYWYAVNNYTGKYIYEGECIGYGIPYSTSYTQPESYAGSGSSIVLPQADPNALYSNGVTTSATWILSLDEKGDVYPRYEEREIAVSQTKIPKRLCEEYSLPEDY